MSLDPTDIEPTRVLVVDDDPEMRRTLRSILEKPGLTVDEAGDGNEAWGRLGDGHYDILFMDWTMPTLGGDGLFNRVKATPQHEWLPIIVVSGFVQTNDKALVAEFPFTALLMKPVRADVLMKTMTTLWMEVIAFGGEFRDISAGLQNIPPQTSVVDHFLDLSDGLTQPVAAILTVAGALHRAGRHQEAEYLARRAIERHPAAPSLMTVLGRALVSQGKYHDARPVLLNAQAASPNNAERSNLLADIALKTLDADQAALHYQRTLHIDPDDEGAQEGLKASQVIDMHIAKKGEGLNGRSTASILNEVGTALVKSGDHAIGIKLYGTALGVATDDETRAKLHLNTGLGYQRWERLSEARDAFAKAVEVSGGELAKANMMLADADKKIQSAAVGASEAAKGASGYTISSEGPASGPSAAPSYQQAADNEIIKRLHSQAITKMTSEDVSRAVFLKLGAVATKSIAVLERSGVHLDSTLRGILRLILTNGADETAAAVGALLDKRATPTTQAVAFEIQMAATKKQQSR